MLISQTLSPLVTPGLREALLFGGDREDWQRVFDTASSFKHDGAVLRVLDSEARREEHRREQERKLIWCAPAPAAASIARPHIFRALFRKDIGGVAGASECWFDSSFYAVDGGTLKVASFLDYVDNSHLLSQISSANQVAVPTADASMQSAFSATFNSAPHSYSSTRAPSLFNAYHDKTGCDVYVGAFLTVDANSYRSILSTRPTTNGFLIARRNGTKMAAYSSNATVDTSTLSYTAPGNMTFNYRLDANLVTLMNGAASDTMVAAGAYTGNPDTTLTLGANTFLTAQMRWRYAYLFRRVLSTAERVIVRQRELATTGMSA